MALTSTILALMLRECATSFGRTPGGYLWALVEPVAGLGLLTLLLSASFSNPPLGGSFALFYASGYLFFMAYTDIAQKLGTAVRFSRPLLGYPVVRLIDLLLARFLLNGLVHAGIVTMVGGAILAVSGNPAPPRPDLVLLGFLLAAILGLGVGCANAPLFERFPLWERAWTIGSRPLLMISGVMFLPEKVSVDYGLWLRVNPVVHIVGVVRHGLYPGYEPDIACAAYVVAVSLALMILGLALILIWGPGVLSEER